MSKDYLGTTKMIRPNHHKPQFKSDKDGQGGVSTTHASNTNIDITANKSNVVGDITAMTRRSTFAAEGGDVSSSVLQNSISPNK